MARRRTKADRIEQAVARIIDDAKYEANRVELNETVRAIRLLSSASDQQVTPPKLKSGRRS